MFLKYMQRFRAEQRPTEMSEARPINRGTIQGSGIGPTDFIVMASDL